MLVTGTEQDLLDIVLISLNMHFHITGVSFYIVKIASTNLTSLERKWCADHLSF